MATYSTIAADVEADKPLLSRDIKVNAKTLVAKAPGQGQGVHERLGLRVGRRQEHVLEVPQVGRWRAEHLRPEVSRHDAQYTTHKVS